MLLLVSLGGFDCSLRSKVYFRTLKGVRCHLQGRIVEVRGADDEARVIYDDDMEEWLSLVQERFQWLAPRAQSAGGTPQLQARAMMKASHRSQHNPFWSQNLLAAPQ